MAHIEELRTQALRELSIVETPIEERFDRITAFAAKEFDVPIALISLVDKDRLWFKSRVGMSMASAQRENSFCGFAIKLSHTLMVQDALEDLRFLANPFVVGEPYARFYAGSLLRMANGYVAGTLCVMDKRPRCFDQLDLAILDGLRDMVVQEISQLNQRWD